jgi:hypothetical protein
LAFIIVYLINRQRIAHVGNRTTQARKREKAAGTSPPLTKGDAQVEEVNGNGGVAARPISCGLVLVFVIFRGLFAGRPKIMNHEYARTENHERPPN